MKKFDINPFYPCPNAKEWYAQQPSTEDAWNNCHRADWLLWIAIKIGIDKRLLTLTAGYCVKTVYHLMNETSRDAVVAAINYGRGKISEDELNAAAAHAATDVAYATDASNAAYAATDVAYATDASNAAYAATDASNAAYAATDAAYAATAAIYAAYAVAYAATDAAYAVAYAAVDNAFYATANADATAAKRKNQQQTADICRKYLTDAVFNKIKQLS